MLTHSLPPPAPQVVDALNAQFRPVLIEAMRETARKGHNIREIFATDITKTDKYQTRK